jgi:hypothetical protein
MSCKNLPVPAEPKAAQPQPRKPKEQILLVAHPAMFRNKPLVWCLTLLSCFVGVGFLIFLFWWIEVKTNTLIITPEYVMKRVGLFSVSETQVFHCDVSRMNINQSLWQRIVGIGDIEIGSSATDDIDIQAFGYPDPRHIRMLINSNRG